MIEENNNPHDVAILREALKEMIGSIQFLPLGVYQLHVLDRAMKALEATKEKSHEQAH